MSRRRHHSAETKLKIVLEVLREEQTVNEIAAKHEVHPNVIGRWKQEFLEKAPEIFKKGISDAERELRSEQEHVARLERKVGQLTVEVDWLEKKSEQVFGYRPTPPTRRQSVEGNKRKASDGIAGGES